MEMDKGKGSLRIKLDRSLLTRIRRALEGVEGLEFAAIIGSLAKRGETHHDIDIAVKASEEEKYPSLCKALESLSKSLGIPEEKIDIVDLDRADLELKKESLLNGLIILDKKGYRERLVKELNEKYPEYNEHRRISIDEWIKKPSNISLEIVKRRLDFIKREMEFLKGNVVCRDVREVKRSPTLRRLMERGFQLIIEAILDICRHITSAMGWGPAISYTDFITICSKHKVIDDELKETLINNIRIRNIIIHRYLEIDYGKLYEEAIKLEETVRHFEKQILNFIKSRGGDEK